MGTSGAMALKWPSKLHALKNSIRKKVDDVKSGAVLTKQKTSDFLRLSNTVELRTLKRVPKSTLKEAQQALELLSKSSDGAVIMDLAQQARYPNDYSKDFSSPKFKLLQSTVLLDKNYRLKPKYYESIKALVSHFSELQDPTHEAAKREQGISH